ncbi:DUF3307 domain-containing protein [Tabrizicola sp. J26]|uniref:DUF3307 domain-containing protein n=1 Tax=Alitabrizicola rongguiensis TaxID=2909234 RepID=UPI001F2D8046|nr:DUF3307 domain-containing protein [Tabrizicola rongguiensis]MCF1710840.1 DUF3307 domain-containing protein [Tabrizicola rongguiensis]
MHPTVVAVLAIVLALQIKHLIADFYLQNGYIIQNRRLYGHPAGLLHVAIHLAGSLVVLVLFHTPLWLLGAMLLCEGLFHYHLDWAKDNYVANRGLTPRDAAFWHAFGIDQALHHASYLAMAWAWAVWA